MEEKIFNWGEEEMGNLAKISREVYNDGLVKGSKEGEERGKIIGINEGRVMSIKRLLSYKLNLDLECMEKINELSISKLEELERKIFEITSWEEVEDIIN